MKASGAYSLQVLKALMMALPASQECFVNHPQLAQSILSSSVNLFAALSGPSNLLSLGVADILRNFSGFWQDQRLAFVTRDMDKVAYWKDISCLLESTAEMYCSLEDAYEFMDFHKQGAFERLDELADNKDQTYSPLEGYLLLNREVPIITRWFEEVIVGVMPRLTAESNYKIAIIEDLIETIKIREKMFGEFNDQVSSIKPSRTLWPKKTKSWTFSNPWSAFSSPIGGLILMIPTDQNFFTVTIPANVLPFYLIGRGKDEPLPDMVVYGDQVTGLPRVDWETYMRVDGNYIEEFQNPDALLLLIEERFKEVLALSIDKATDYFVQRFIYDQANLTADFMVGLQGTTISPHDAMIRVQNYLKQLQQTIIDDMTNVPFVEDDAQQFIIRRYHPVQLGKISETVDKLKVTLDRFKILVLSLPMSSPFSIALPRVMPT